MCLILMIGLGAMEGRLSRVRVVEKFRCSSKSALRRGRDSRLPNIADALQDDVRSNTLGQKQITKLG